MLIAALSLASRILGLLRDRLLASTFGATGTLDAYFAAFRIPDLLFNLLGLGALSAAFLPVYVRLRGRDSASAAVFASRVLSDLAVLLLILCAVGAIAATPLFRALAPGFSPDQLALTVSLGRVMFLGTFLLGASTVAGGILQAERRFLAFASAPIAYNVGIIVGILAFVPSLGAIGLAWGVVLGAALHLAVQWVSAVRVTGERPSWSPSFRDANVRTTFALLVPRILGLASDQAQLLAIAAIASLLPAGSLAVFTFASNIQMVPVALIGVAFAVAAFPQLAAAAQDTDRARFRTSLSSAIREVALLALPSVVLLLTLKAQAVRILLGSGAFDWGDTVRTLRALEAFGLGLFGAMLVPLLARACYALEDTRTPFVVGLVTNAIAVAFAFWFGHRLGPQGLALAVAAGSAMQATVLLAIVRTRVGDLDDGRILRSIMRFSLAAVAMAVVIQAVKPVVASFTGTDTFVGIGLQGAIAAFLGCGVYLTVGVLLGSEEITALARALHRRVLRLAALPPSGADEARG